MSRSDSHTRQPSGSSSVSSRSYSRPLSSWSAHQSAIPPQPQQPAEQTATEPSPDSPPVRFSRPRAGGIDFGQPLAEETAEPQMSELNGHRRQPPPSSSSTSQPESRYSSGAHSTTSSGSSSGSSRRGPNRDRQLSNASVPLPSSSTSSVQANRLSQPLPLTPTTPTSSARSHRSPISPTHPNYSPNQSPLKRQSSVPPRTSSLPPPTTGRAAPPSSASRRTPRPPSGGTPTASPRHSQQIGSLASPYTVYQVPGSARTSFASDQDDEATVRQRKEARQTATRSSFEAAPSSWKMPTSAEPDEPARVHGRRRSSLVQSEAALGREMLDSSVSDDDADDLLGYQELRRPSWMVTKNLSLSTPSGRSDSTTTITQANARRQDRHADALIEEPAPAWPPPATSDSSAHPSSRIALSHSTSDPTSTPVRAVVPPSEQTSTSSRSNARPPPIVLPPVPQPRLPGTSANASNRPDSTASIGSAQSAGSRLSISIPGPVASPPALPTRSPLRPRLSSPTPSQTSSTSSNGGPSRHHRQSSDPRSSVAYSDISLDMGDLGPAAEVDPSRLGVGPAPSRTDRIRSVSSPGVASWSSANGKERQSAFEPTAGGISEVWLDEDTDHLSTRRPQRELTDSHTPSTKGTTFDGQARPRSRPPSVGSRPGSERMKQRRREARVSTMYTDSGSVSEMSDEEESPSSGFPPSNVPAGSVSAATVLPFANHANSQPAFPSAPSLGPRSPSCPAFSSLEEIPDETGGLPSELTIKQNLNLAASPTITLPLPPVPSPAPPASPAHALAHARSSSQPLASSAPDKPLPTPTSKRAHLLHEIHSTERSYAQDLALVRDAYIHRLRPTPTTSSRNSMVNTDSTLLDDQGLAGDRKSNLPDRTGKTSAPGNLSLGFASAGASHSSLLPPFSPEGARSPLTASDAASITSNSYFSSYGTVSSPRSALSPGSHFVGVSGGMAVGPLSAGDARAVFLNVEAIATLAEEFASVLEKMAAQPQGEDMMGEAFLTMMPRIKQAYSAYCPRQSTANVRLVELLADSRYASYFAECWAIAQPHTKSWDLPSLLIKPVQRVLKYPLLLDDLLKCTPANHPDHANLEQAVVLVRTLADEINEAKRRKDTVDRIIHGKNADVSSTSTLMSRDTKSKRGVSVKIGFKKDKDRVTSVATSTHTTGSSASVQFASKAHNELRKTEEGYAALVSKLMAAETTAKKMGKIVAGCGSKAKEAWEAQMATVEGWRRLINLGGLEPVEDIRIEAYRVVVHQILEGPCREMDEELRVSIVPNVLALLAVCKGPRTVILKRNSKHADYNRVVNATNNDQWDRLSPDLIEGAQIFAALHHQLLVELPTLLDGFAAILNLIVNAIAACQAKFHKAVYKKLGRFWEDFPPVVVDPEAEATDVCSGGAAIMRVWEESARTPMEMMEALPITQKINVRVMDAPVLIASGSSTPNAHGILSRTPSTLSIRRSETSSSTDRKVRHSTASSSSTTSLPFESRSRSSSSAKGPPPPMPTPPSPLPTPDPKSGGLFHFRSKSKSKPSTSSSSSKLERNASQTSTSSASQAAPTLSSRSQTLPPLPIPGRSSNPARNSAHSTASSHGPALSAMSFEGSDQNHEAFSEAIARRLSEPDSGGEDPDQTIGPYSSHPCAASSSSGAKTASNGRENASSATRVDAPPNNGSFGNGQQQLQHEAQEEDDNPPTMYRCECVADFDLRGLSISYMGHDFLSIRRGDEIEVVFEIGRVDELEDFPLDVGLEDDGLLIGRDRNGVQGFVLCSFLHPLDAE